MSGGNTFDQRFAERLQLLRRFRRISQEELGLRAGMTRTAVIHVEQQRRRVSLGEAIRLAEALGVPLVDMYSEGELVLPPRVPVG